MKILEYGIKEYSLIELLKMANIDPRHLAYSNLTEYLNTISKYWQIKYYSCVHHNWVTMPNFYSIKYIYDEIACIKHYYTNKSIHKIFLYAVPTDCVSTLIQISNIKQDTYKKLKEII